MDDFYNWMGSGEGQEYEQAIFAVQDYLAEATLDVDRKRIRPKGADYSSVDEIAKRLNEITDLSQKLLADAITGWLEMEYSLPPGLSADENEALENRIIEWVEKERELIHST